MLFIQNLKAAATAGVQLKSVKHVETHRGIAWSCTVFLNGSRLGMVSNEGNGGMSRFDFNLDDQKKVEAALKQAGYILELTLGQVTISEPATTTDWLEFAIGQIGDEMTDLKGFKRRAKAGHYVEKKTEPTFAYIKGPQTQAFRAQIQNHFGDDLVRFLNDEILAL